MDDGRRQTSSSGGAFPASAGVKPRVSAGMADSSVSAQKTEGPMFPRKLMEEIVHAENVKKALERVEITRREELRKEVRTIRCSAISCSMNWIGSLRGEGIVS